MDRTSDAPPSLRAGLVRLTVCGLDELHGAREAAVTHVLSILDPGYPDPTAFGSWRRHHRLTLRFHDVIAEYPGYDAPRPEHVAALLRFGEELHAAGDDLEHLLIHCHAGVSRSTAALAILLAREHPEDEAAVFERLVAIRPQAWPNSRMIGFADEMLGRSGRLRAALQDFYRLQARTRPDLVEMIRRVGRGAEIPA
jgi:predicted protein tyrosine phosphatase